MFNYKKGLLMAAVTTAICITATVATAASTKDAARDDRGNFVRSTNGNCVRTRWQGNEDPCNPPAPPPAPQVVEEKKEVVISEARKLQKEQRTIYFDFDKANLTAESTTKLDSLAEVLKADKDVKAARIVGYADRYGSDEYNEKLSQKRSKAVNDYLVSRGYLNTSVAETRWLGESSPITKCPTTLKRAEQIKCLAEDRRVEVEIDFLTK